MGQLSIPGTSIQYSNPKQVDQNTLVFPNGMVTPGYPPNVGGTLAGVTWTQNGVGGSEPSLQMSVRTFAFFLRSAHGDSSRFNTDNLIQNPRKTTMLVVCVTAGAELAMVSEY
jgi:hypothetical protein